MGCSCILLTWACRNRQGSITSRVAKFGKRIKETAIPCLADSMASIVPFQVHRHSAGRRKGKGRSGRQAARRRGGGLFPFRGAVLSTDRAANWAAGRARPLSWAAAMLSVCRARLSASFPSSLPGRHAPGNLHSVPGCARSIPIPPSFATATAPPHLPDAHVTHTAGTPTAKAYAEQRGAIQAGNRKYTAL